MIRVSNFEGKMVALFGLGASGRATALALQAGGAEVAAWDDSTAACSAAQDEGISVVDLTTANWSGFAALILAPGVPLTHPEPHWTVAKARAAGIEIIGDIELFCRIRAQICPYAPFAAITGTNGKSTTTALLAHILRSAGRDVALGGNIGTPILALPEPAPDRVHVVELSSFQIDLTPSLAPTVGILLNLTPDHLDRHGTMEHYAAIKERLVANSRHAIVSTDDTYCRAITQRLQGRADGNVDVFSVLGPVPGGWWAEGTRLVCDAAWPGFHGPFADLDGIGTLRGRHNAQNALAACMAALRLGVDPEQLPPALATFPGLPHRMEEVGRLGRVLFINDSKATNADSTEKALSAFPSDIFWIVGGRAKEGGIEPLRDYFPRIAKAYLIGESAEAFAATLGNSVPFDHSGTLEVAVQAAARDATQCAGAEPVVLLSPACASYDQFKNFEQRGDAFRRLVTALPGVTVTNRS